MTAFIDINNPAENLESLAGSWPGLHDMYSSRTKRKKGASVEARLVVLGTVKPFERSVAVRYSAKSQKFSSMSGKGAENQTLRVATTIQRREIDHPVVIKARELAWYLVSPAIMLVFIAMCSLKLAVDVLGREYSLVMVDAIGCFGLMIVLSISLGLRLRLARRTW